MKLNNITHTYIGLRLGTDCAIELNILKLSQPLDRKQQHQWMPQGRPATIYRQRMDRRIRVRSSRKVGRESDLFSFSPSLISERKQQANNITSKTSIIERVGCVHTQVHDGGRVRQTRTHCISLGVVYLQSQSNIDDILL